MRVEPLVYSGTAGIVRIGQLEIHAKTVIADQLIVSFSRRHSSVTRPPHEAR